MINVSRDKSIHVELLSNSRHPKMFVTSGDTGDNMRFSVWSIQWMQQTRARSLARDSGQFSQCCALDRKAAGGLRGLPKGQTAGCTGAQGSMPGASSA